MGKGIELPNIPEEEQTPLVKELLVSLEQLAESVQRQADQIQQLKDEIRGSQGREETPEIQVQQDG